MTASVRMGEIADSGPSPKPKSSLLRHRPITICHDLPTYSGDVERYDVIILGGVPTGIAGAITAAGLAVR